MISGIVDIKLSGHFAAQKTARHTMMRSAWNSAAVRGKAEQRNEQLDWLAESGYNRFLLTSDKSIAPVASGVREDDESCWSWALYSLSEIKAMDAAYEMEIFKTLPKTPESQYCSCGGYIRHPQTLRGQGVRPDFCMECAEVYSDNPERIVAENIISACGWGLGHYGGPGRSFSHPATAWIVRNRVLIKQYSGLDI